MSGNYYSIDIWGLPVALAMVATAAGVSGLMRMGVGKTLLWSACRALLQLCAMGLIMGYVIRPNNIWLVFALIAALTLLADSLIMAMVYRTCFTKDDRLRLP